MMDREPFLEINLSDVAREGTVVPSVLEGICSLIEERFDPGNIGTEALDKKVFQSLVSQIRELALQPTKDRTGPFFVAAGAKYLRQTDFDKKYRQMFKDAFKEFFEDEVKRRLLPPPVGEVVVEEPPKPANGGHELTGTEVQVSPTKDELDIYNWTRSRLAFLVKDDSLFEKLNDIGYKKTKATFRVFYKKVNVGLLFGYSQGKKGKHIFDFKDSNGKAIEVDNLKDIDKILLESFCQRVSEI
jgi:hypothetical protein